MKRIAYILILLTFLTNCKTEDIVTNCENPNLTFLVNDNFIEGDNYSYDALILNEGGYTYGNASLNSWNTNGNHSQNIFKTINNYGIGDILQSAYKTEEEIYLLVNNSQKIEVIDKNNLKRKRTITGFTSPRHMAIIGDIALVTDLYANKINVFNTKINCELNSIIMQGWTEQIFNINDRIYVIERSEVGAASRFANLVEIALNIAEDETVFTIAKRTSIPIEPNSVIVDVLNNIWILSAGSESDDIFPVLNKFSTITNSIEKTKTYTNFTEAPQKLSSHNNYSNASLFYSKGQKIYSLTESSSNHDFVSNELFTHVAQNLYNFTFVTTNQTFLICDAKDYLSDGEVLNYSYTGNLIAIIPSGIIPNSIIFQ